MAQKVQSSYEQTQDLKMTFVQETYVQLLEQTVTKKGVAFFKKPGKFAIRYGGSRGKFYLSDGKSLWIGKKGDAKIQTQKINDQEIPAEALSFLGGLGNLSKDFEVEAVDPKKWKQFKRSKGDAQWLELTPLKKQSHIEWLVMGFDPTTFLAKEVYLYTDSGNLSHYRFSEVQANVGLPDQDFILK
ncbi:MAG: outer membrane lipoprotein carrier protein LolA [bacterium]|nr:outer membrane lipoprotein carrier protein LolA [bacterium]